MRGTFRVRDVLYGIAVVAIFLLSLLLSRHSAQLPNFNPDESRWIARAHYLADLADPFGPTWGDQYMTRGQPPFGSYVTGAGLLLHGRDLATNPPWDFSLTWEENLAAGNKPIAADLQAARSMSAILTATTAVVLIGVASVYVPMTWALLAGGIFALHPFSRYIGALATADAVFGLLIALAALAIAQYAQNRVWQWALITGVLLGLGGATKLSPLAVASGLAGMALLLAVLPAEFVADGEGRGKLAGSGLLIGLAAGLTFIAVYPYLWPDPVGRTMNLFTFRAVEMATQASDWPVMAVPNRVEAVRRMGLNFSEHYSLVGAAAEAAHLRVPRTLLQVEALIAVVGIGVMARDALRVGWLSAQTLVLAVLGGQVIVTILGMRAEFDRYHLPAALLGAVAMCVALHAIVTALHQGISGWPARQGPPVRERMMVRG
jgi:hypothetical protein